MQIDLVTLRPEDFPILNTYISIPLPGSIKQLLASTIQKIQESLPEETLSKIKFQNPDTAHITIHFIGKIDVKIFEKLKADMHSFFKTFINIPIHLGTIGHFKKKIIFVSVESEDLQMAFTKWHQAYPNWALDHKEFMPHMTIARISHLNSESEDRFEELMQLCLQESSFIQQSNFIVETIEVAGVYRGKHQAPLIRFE